MGGGIIRLYSIVNSPGPLSWNRSWHLPTCRVVIPDTATVSHHRNPPTHSKYGEAPLTCSGPHAYASPDQSFDPLSHHPSTTGKCYRSIIDNPESESDLPRRKKPRSGSGAVAVGIGPGRAVGRGHPQRWQKSWRSGWRPTVGSQ